MIAGNDEKAGVEMMLKKMLLPLWLLLLAGCASSGSTVILNPTMALPVKGAGQPGVSVSVSSADKRPAPTLAAVNRGGQLVSLLPSRDPRFLLQEVLEKQMIARGYSVDNNGAIAVQVVINKLSAEVAQGDLRYHINSSASVSLVISSQSGRRFTQTYQARYSVEGALQASNSNIAKAINNVLSNIITDMANDNSITDFIRQNG